MAQKLLAQAAEIRANTISAWPSLAASAQPKKAVLGAAMTAWLEGMKAGVADARARSVIQIAARTCTLDDSSCPGEVAGVEATTGLKVADVRKTLSTIVATSNDTTAVSWACYGLGQIHLVTPNIDGLPRKARARKAIGLFDRGATIALPAGAIAPPFAAARSLAVDIALP